MFISGGTEFNWSTGIIDTLKWLYACIHLINHGSFQWEIRIPPLNNFEIENQIRFYGSPSFAYGNKERNLALSRCLRVRDVQFCGNLAE